MIPPYTFDTPDPVLVALTEQLSPGQRIQRLLDARALAAGLIRGRLRQEFPELPQAELNLKVLEAIEDAKQR